MTIHLLLLMIANKGMFLRTIMNRLKHATAIRNTLSSGLPASMDSPPMPNQIPNGLLAFTNNQMVGIQNAKEISGDNLRSKRKSPRTNNVQIISAIVGGIER